MEVFFLFLKSSLTALTLIKWVLRSVGPLTCTKLEHLVIHNIRTFLKYTKPMTESGSLHHWNELSCSASNPFTHFYRKCSGAHFLTAFPHLWLTVGGDGGQQVQHGQDSPRMDDHHVRRRRGGSGVGGVGQVELQVRQCFDGGRRARWTVVTVSERETKQRKSYLGKNTHHISNWLILCKRNPFENPSWRYSLSSVLLFVKQALNRICLANENCAN